MQRRFLNIFFKQFSSSAVRSPFTNYSTPVSLSLHPYVRLKFIGFQQFLSLFFSFSHRDKLASRFLYNIKNLAFVIKHPPSIICFVANTFYNSELDSLKWKVLHLLERKKTKKKQGGGHTWNGLTLKTWKEWPDKIGKICECKSI